LEHIKIKLTFTCNCQLNCGSLSVSIYFKIHFDLTHIDFFAARLNLESSGNAGLLIQKYSNYVRADRSSESNTSQVKTSWCVSNATIVWWLIYFACYALHACKTDGKSFGSAGKCVSQEGISIKAMTTVRFNVYRHLTSSETLVLSWRNHRWRSWRFLV